MSKEAVESISIHTQSPSRELLEKFSSLVPGVIQDGVLDVARLGELLGIPTAGVPDTKERFGLMWAGKAKAVEALQAPSMASLAPDEENSVDWDTARNVFIEGDNLEVLKLLQKSYNDKVDLIYIDPPYNTGNDFVYSDDFSDSVKRYLEVTNQIDAEGNRLVANSEVSGRKHSNWITMMYPRLMLARNLLKDDGALFVSIDDNELDNLRKLLDEVFGAENFIACLPVILNPKGRQLDRFFATSHEYLVVYGRDALNCALDPSSSEDVDEADFPQIDTDGTRFRFLPLRNTNHKFNPSNRPNLAYPLFGNPETGEVKTSNFSGAISVMPIFGDTTSAVWRWSKDLAQKRCDELCARKVSGRNGERVDIFQKDFLSEGRTKKIQSVFTSEQAGSTDAAVSELKKIVGPLFQSPKPTKLLERLVSMFPSDSLIIDLFAGSGTTGHAVALQNERDGGTRRYILVNAPESTDEKSTARAEGFEKVSEITRLRLQKVIETIPSAAASGLRCFTLSPSSFVSTGELVEGGLPLLNESTLRKSASNDEIASEALLKQGVALDQPWVKKKYGKAAVVQAGRVSVVLAKEITHEIVEAALADETSSTVVFLEDGFAGRDEVKANAHFAFKQKNKTMKTI